MQPLRFLFWILLLGCVGCEPPTEALELVHPGPEYWVTGENLRKTDTPNETPSSVIPFHGGWTSFSMDPGVTSVDSRIEELVLDRLVFRAPIPGDSLDFIERMELYLPGGPGAVPTLLATYERSEDYEEIMPTIQLDAFQTWNIQPDLDRGIPFLVTLQGTPPSRDTAIDSQLHLLGTTRAR